MQNGPGLTVGTLRAFLFEQEVSTRITFGSSRSRQRPLVFHRFKQRGPKLLQIELSELDCDTNDMHEWEYRPTVDRFLSDLRAFTDDWEIVFGASADACPLQFQEISNVIAIDLEQSEKSQYTGIADRPPDSQ